MRPILVAALCALACGYGLATQTATRPLIVGAGPGDGLSVNDLLKDAGTFASGLASLLAIAWQIRSEHRKAAKDDTK